MTFSVDLKHLSWLSVVGDDRQKLMRSPTKKEINENFQGTRVVENVFSGYYQFNKQKHFVQTNQNVAKSTNKVDTKIGTKIIEEFDPSSDNYNLFGWTDQNVIKKGTEIDSGLKEKLNYENCDLKNPDESFEVRRKDEMGLGLYAKHDIPKGSFSFIFISYL